MAKDPYRYFRVEAGELLDGLTRGAMELERGAGGEDVLPRLRRFAHTLKGAARVVRQTEIADLAHAIEDALGAPVSRASADVLLGLLDRTAVLIAALGPAPDVGTPASGPGGPRSTVPSIRLPEPLPGPAVKGPVDALTETVRVDIDDVDALLKGTAEAAVQVAAIREAARHVAEMRVALAALIDVSGPRPGAAADRARAMAAALDGSLKRMDRGVALGVERAEREIAGLRDTASRLRLVPASALFGSLERAARDAASSTGRLVSFEVAGGDNRLEGHVLAALRDALLHVVRNAVAHGAEPEAERRAAGKAAELRVTLTVERRGNRVAFTCADDGRGIDVEAVRRAAVRLGTVGAPEAAAMADADVTRLVLQGGLTTKATVTEIAGRGVGLDVLREVAARLQGTISIRSERGRGTSVEVCVPSSLSSLAVLVVEAGGCVVSIPLDAVRRASRVAADEIAHAAARDSVLHEGRPIPVLALGRALAPEGAGDVDRERRRAHRRGAAARQVVIVEAAGALAAVDVERVVGTANVVIRPLPAPVAAQPLVMGVALDAQGHPALVLDPAGLVEAAASAASPDGPEPAALRRPVLVVDDSLTTRMLEQSILESAGYDVELATSAEEALRAAERKRYGLFVVDVEMPGMDGFQFVARTRADPVLRETPAILVTSRGSPADRERGARAGARAYIVKGEFDQVKLLHTVRELMG